MAERELSKRWGGQGELLGAAAVRRAESSGRERMVRRRQRGTGRAGGEVR